MGRKDVIQPFPVVVDGDMSGQITSLITDCRYIDNIAYQVKWSGSSPSGEYFIDTTLDEVTGPLANPTWTPLDFGLQMLVAGNSGDDIVNVNQLPFAFIRFRYEPALVSPGTGMMQVKIAAKQVGG